MPPSTAGAACGVAGGVSDSVSAPPSASVNASVSSSVSDIPISSPCCPCSGRDAAVRNVSTELAREPGRTPPRGAEGIRNEDGAIGFRIVGAAVTAAASKDGKAGRWLFDATGSSEVSVTAPSTEKMVAFVTVAAVDAVATVGDGDGGRGGAISTGSIKSRSFVSSDASGSGDDIAITGSDEDIGCGAAVNSAGGGGEDPDDLESGKVSS